MVLLALSIFPVGVFPSVSSSSNNGSTSSCNNSILVAQSNQLFSTLNTSKAKSLAKRNLPTGNNYSYDSIFNLWSWNPSSCAITWNSVNIVYDQLDSSGMAVQKIIIQENTALTAVQNTSTQDSNLIAANGQQQYAGYEYSNWIQSGAAWSGAYAQWTVPTASAPSGKC